MTRQQFETWFGGTWLAAGDNGAALLCVRSTFIKELLETRFRDRIVSAIAEVTGQRCPVEVVVAASVPPTERELAARPRPAAHTHAAKAVLPRGPSAGGAPLGATQTLFELASPPIVAGISELPDASFHHGGTVPASAPAAAAGRTRPPSGTANLQRSRATTPLAQQRSDGVHSGDGERPRQHVAAQAAAAPPEKRTPTDSSAGGEEGPGAPHRLPGSPSHGSRPSVPPLPLPSDRDSSSALPGPRLNPRYTFATFIVGSANQLAHAASQAVVDAPGEAYNPLFLYGGVGLGKTHLLHAIGHATMDRGLTVLYVSSETFTNEIIDAIRYRTTDEFRAKYRSVDVLLVDDIQFIAGKDSTEEEFFHTFNSLHEANKQIVICSDRPPKAIVSLAERLRSRFEWGLIADIQPPDMETRIAILRAKSEMMGRMIPDEVVAYLASRVQSNIRELEGSLNRLIAFAHLQGMPLTTETVKAALANLASDGKPRRVTIAEILDAVADHFRIPTDDIRGKQRDKHIVVPRQIAMYLMRQETEASLLEIGQALGGRDHSTVLHGCEKISREINDNTSLRKEVLAIRQQLLG
jgi:chromosomal replication initiator protein